MHQIFTYRVVCVCVLGSIFVADDLDFEVCKDYYLTIEAWDGGNPPLSSATVVAIDLMDVNDNAPTFSEDIYNVLVSEDASVGQTVIRVTKTNSEPGLPLVDIFAVFHHLLFLCDSCRCRRRTWIARGTGG